MSIEQQQWLNQNRYRNYPIKEDCPAYAVGTGGALLPDVQLPTDLLVDFVLTVATPDAGLRVYLSSVALIGTSLALEFKDHNDVQITTLAVATGSHTLYKQYPLIGVGDYEDARGTVVLGDLSHLRDVLPEGQFEFSLATTELEPSVVRPDIRGVRSLQCENNGVVTTRMFGHVRLVAGTNIRLVALPEYNAIRIDALDSTGFNEECDCVDAFTLPCVRMINGINIEDVQLVGDKCLEVTTVGNQIRFTDRCSQPCCGCVELDYLNKNMDLLTQQLGVLEGYSTELRDKIISFINAVLVSSI